MHKYTYAVHDLDRYRVHDLCSEGFLDKFQKDPWGTCALTLRNGFDSNSKFDFQFCLCYSIKYKLIAKEKNLINSYSISIIIGNMSSRLFKALQKNDKRKFEDNDSILAIAKYMDKKTIEYSVTDDFFYNEAIKLYKIFLNSIQYKEHWIHQSLNVQTYFMKYGQSVENLIMEFGKRVFFEKAITPYKKNETYQRILYLYKFHNTAKKAYLQSIMDTKNQRMIKYSTQIQCRTDNKCANIRCKRKYIQHKYNKTISEIVKTLQSGQKMQKINKWYKCKRCRLHLYCSRRCQKIHWNSTHNKYCVNYID